jgi:hypothetical protein
VDVFVDKSGQFLIKGEVEVDAVLHIVAFECQSIGRVRTSRFDEIFADLDVVEIAEPDGGKGEDCNCGGDLCRYRGLTGAWSLRERASSISSFGRDTTSLQTPGVNT